MVLPYFAIRFVVSMFDPSSATITSMGEHFCQQTDAITHAKQDGLLYVVMMRLIFTWTRYLAIHHDATEQHQRQFDLTLIVGVDRWPKLKLSETETSWPLREASRAQCEPMYPAPPVTKPSTFNPKKWGIYKIRLQSSCSAKLQWLTALLLTALDIGSDNRWKNPRH